ncbi:MAG: hypothetical protein QM779_12315 [Propionicimonas sp.]|uniref:hypothetical protein n=1 Tax=Propionicimonas sp. TaxID=1955623 RepID=UPI003D12EBDA
MVPTASPFTRRRFLGLAAGATAAAAVAPLLSACTSGGGAASPSASAVSAFPTSWSDEITIDVFDGLANKMGVQPGWFAKIVHDRFNMKLNIIAPNVAGGGDTLYNTRVAAGNLGDLIITDKGQKFDELTDGGLLLDSTPYFGSMTNVSRFDRATTKLNDGKDGTYGFPLQVSGLKPTDPSEGIDPTFGPMLRWDLYAKVGYPAIGTLEDLLPVLQQMQQAQPTAANGKKVYALSLFKDWDGNMMTAGKQPACFYGYDEMGFVLAKADGSDYQSIVDPNSAYVRSLKFFNKANQMGMLDPDSTTQNYDTVFSKIQKGQVLFSFWPWQGQAAFNTTDNMADGKGFMIAPLADMLVFSYGAAVYGGTQILTIGSKAKDPERIAAFANWIYSSEGTYTNNSQTQGAAGPRTLTWDLNADKKPELNDFGMKALAGAGADVPTEWGGGTYTDGASWLNFTAVLPIDTDPDTGYPFSYKMWETFQATQENPLTKDWSSHMGNAKTTMGYLKDNNKLLVAPGAGFTTPTDDSEIQTLRNQIKASIVEYSWKASFAKDDSSFNSLIDELGKTVDGLGYAKVLEVDMANAKSQNDARLAVVKDFG